MFKHPYVRCLGCPSFGALASAPSKFGAGVTLFGARVRWFGRRYCDRCCHVQSPGCVHVGCLRYPCFGGRCIRVRSPGCNEGRCPAFRCFGGRLIYTFGPRCGWSSAAILWSTYFGARGTNASVAAFHEGSDPGRPVGFCARFTYVGPRRACTFGARGSGGRVTSTCGPRDAMVVRGRVLYAFVARGAGVPLAALDGCSVPGLPVASVPVQLSVTGLR